VGLAVAIPSHYRLMGTVIGKSDFWRFSAFGGWCAKLKSRHTNLPIRRENRFWEIGLWIWLLISRFQKVIGSEKM